MTTYTRRQWSKIAFSSLALAGVIKSGDNTASGMTRSINSRFGGVQIGAQSYSFRDRSLERVIEGLVAAQIGSCELWQVHLEQSAAKLTGDAQRAELHRLRLTTPLSFYKDVRVKFERAGIKLDAYNYSMRADFTDEEIKRGFDHARALGVRVITSSSNLSDAKRIDRYAREYKMPVGFHNHSENNPNEFSSPQDFMRGLDGASKYLAINLDVGHFTAANHDAVEFIKKHHTRIVALHLKDRRRNQGANTPFGEGDAPLAGVLQLMRANNYKFPANIEYEYDGTDAVAEVKRCREFCRAILEKRQA